MFVDKPNCKPFCRLKDVFSLSCVRKIGCDKRSNYCRNAFALPLRTVGRTTSALFLVANSAINKGSYIEHENVPARGVQFQYGERTVVNLSAVLNCL